MKTLNEAVMWFLILPFVFSAAIKFLPLWLSAPIGFALIIFWIVSILVIGRGGPA